MEVERCCVLVVGVPPEIMGAVEEELVTSVAGVCATLTAVVLYELAIPIDDRREDVVDRLAFPEQVLGSLEAAVSIWFAYE